MHGGRARPLHGGLRSRAAGGLPRRDAGPAPFPHERAAPDAAWSDAKEDHEHARGGTASAFAALDLKGGRRLIEATERRAKEDFARFVRRVVDELCAGCQRVRLVLDNLSTHSKAALDAAFAPAEACRLAQAVELRFTPKHGSWPDAVEMELSAAKSRRLDRRVASLRQMRRELAAGQDERNARKAGVRWTFDVPSARQAQEDLPGP